MRRPGNLGNLGRFWFGGFGENKKSTQRKKVLHPDIYQYSVNHISPNIVKGARQVEEQIYTFDLFTPDFCRKVIEEAEFQGGWETGIDSEAYPDQTGLGMTDVDLKNFKSLRTENEKDTTLSLKRFPSNNRLSLLNTINQTSKKHIKPLIENKWQSFTISRYDPPYLLKYDPKNVNKMNLHYDLETVALVVYLNTDYKGGGTYFPRWKFHMQPQKPGQAAMWPGGVSHEHIGMPITGGLRYLLCCAYF
jgi:hypothetical protein